MSNATKSQPVSLRLPPSLNERLATIAATLDRPKSWVIEQALKDYLTLQTWHQAAIEEGIQAADAGQVARHEDVAAWVGSWGESDEVPPPECG